MRGAVYALVRGIVIIGGAGLIVAGVLQGVMRVYPMSGFFSATAASVLVLAGCAVALTLDKLVPR